MFERGECQYQNLFSVDSVPTFESNIAYTLRFMIDTKVCLSAAIYRFIVYHMFLGCRYELDRGASG